MISLSAECLLFQLVSGESVPLSAEMISIELGGEDAGLYDPEFVQHAARAVFHYFKHELSRESVTVAEFAGALEKVLLGLGFGTAPRPEPAWLPPRAADLRKLAAAAGKGFELFFFPQLRDELRAQLIQTPRHLRFCGLRGCVKQLAGARRWSPRCQRLRDQIVEYLRHCLSTEAAQADCSLLLD